MHEWEGNEVQRRKDAKETGFPVIRTLNVIIFPYKIS